MTETLLNWLNNDIKLSKQITDIPKDFRSGYYFAELLHKTNHLPIITSYKNSTNKNDIIQNLHQLQKNLNHIGVILNEQCKYKIMNADIYTSKIYLYKIKKLLESKNINLELLHFRNSIALSKLYNSIYFKSDNDKYLKIKPAPHINTTGINNYKYSRKYEPNKYSIGGQLYKEIRKEYSHLDLTDFDMEIIMADIKETEYKINYLKDYVHKSEEKRKDFNRLREDNEIKFWTTSLNGLNSLKRKIINKSINKVKRNINLFKDHMQSNTLNFQNNAIDFDNKLSLFETRKKVTEDEEYNRTEEDLDEINQREYKKYIVLMRDINLKMKNKMKSQKDKEKRERQKHKDENMSLKSIAKDDMSPFEKTLGKDNIVTEAEKEKVNDLLDAASSRTSTYSKLTKGDYCTNLIKNSFNIHKDNIPIGNRIGFFKTMIDMNNKEEKLPEINIKKDFEKKIIVAEEKKGFNEEDFFNALNKQNHEVHAKLVEKKNIRNKKNKKLIKPIVEQLLEITDYIYDYKNQNNIKLINDEIWKDIRDKFISNESLNQSEDDFLLIKNEEKKEEKEEENDDENGEKNSENEEERKTNYIENLYEDLFNDYLNYTGIFNDIIIPYELRGKKYSYIELYSDFYDHFSSKVEIKDYEPVADEIENLYLPKYINGKDNNFYDVLMEIIDYLNNPKNKKNEGNINSLKNELSRKNPEGPQDGSLIKNIIKKKGKYFYLPIKMAFVGYPLSGKKTQSKLLQSIYPNLKIYNPENIFKDILNEYKELFENSENNPKVKAMRPNQLEQYKKEIEEKKEKFQPTLEIIKPYIDFMEKEKEREKEKENELKSKEEENTKDNKTKDNKNNKDKKGEINKNNQKNDKAEQQKEESKNNDENPEINSIKDDKDNNNDNKQFEEEKENILGEIYMKLLLKELEKDFNEDDQNILNTLTNNKNTFSNYCQTLQKINEIKEKMDVNNNDPNEPKDQKDKKPVKKEAANINNNLIKELEALNRDLSTLKSTLISGFIIINFPKNEKEALSLEKYFTGFQLDYEKPKNPVEEKLKSYNIVNFNLEKKNLNKSGSLISFLDLFINFDINSSEVDNRYNNLKYDPTTGRVYTTEEIATINDKKLLERLEKGLPDINDESIKNMKTNYDKEIYNVSKLYKKMNNGLNTVYMNINQEDAEKKYMKEINPDIQNSIEEIVFKYFYKNVDETINNINENIVKKEQEEKGKENDDAKKKEEQKDMNIIKEEDKIANAINGVNNPIGKSTYSIYNEIILNIDSLFPDYKLTIKSLIYFMSKQRKDIIIYLNQIQNEFIEFLNMKSEKNDIIEMYTKKYNTIFKLYPELRKNKKVCDDLMNDITNVSNAIWVNIQTKKEENIKYLEKIKNSGEKEKKINKFIAHILKLFEQEISIYLIKCEIILKYHLNKLGLLNDIMGIFQHSNDEFMFKIEYKKYLYHNFNIESLANIISNNTNYSTKPEFKNTLSTNETQNKFSKTKNKNNVLDFEKILENNLQKLFVNALKIIIRQDKLNSKYIDKIKLFLSKDNKYNTNKGTSTNSKEISLKNVKKGNISSVSFPNNNNVSIITSRSSFKKKFKNINNQISNYDSYSEENVKNHLTEEKNILKYRLMYLISFVLKYIGIINDCYNNVFNNMDEWIIMNMDTQNNKLDEFIGYLKRALNKKFDEISMKGREFYYNDKYAKNKKLVLPIYKNLYPDSIINISKQFSKGDNFQKNLVKLQDLNYFQQYIYNINDLIIFYQAIKEYGLQTCEYFVKYEIVKELFMNYVINQKEYSYFYEDLSLPKSNITNNNIISNNMNGVCKKMKFYSYEKIDKFIKIFCVYDNKYININELFTTLMIIGSELIDSEKFEKSISEYVPEEKRNKTKIILSLEEYMKIPLWFEEDKYLNELSDLSEEKIFIGDYIPSYSINQINQQSKIKYAEKTDNQSGLSSSNKDENINEVKIEKEKKINKIKETIFEINKEDNQFDINLFKVILDKLNDFCKDKNKNNKKVDNNKNCSEDIDVEDKCFRFSYDNSDEFIDIEKQKSIKNHTYIVNNIFNNIFEK